MNVEERSLQPGALRAGLQPGDRDHRPLAQRGDESARPVPPRLAPGRYGFAGRARQAKEVLDVGEAARSAVCLDGVTARARAFSGLRSR